ncbi:MAG: glycosyltransferase family 9 protein [Verrucomicrobia bacterium]|nr:glycosyltransferase family 9 protein [Verrucomicrobiota bacterium]
MGPTLNTRKLQFIDRWIGMAVCWVLSTIRSKLPRGSSRGAFDKPRKILFVKFAEQGSTVLAYHAIERAIAMVGMANVYFLVFEENRFILDVMNVIPKQNVITVAHKSILGGAWCALRALRKLRSLQVDSAVDLEFFSRSSAALTFLSGASRRVGYHTFFGEGPYRGDLMTHRLLYNPYLHTSQSFQLMVDALHRSPDQLPTNDSEIPKLTQLPLKFVPSAREKEEVFGILRRQIRQDSPLHLFLLNPNASDLLPLRKWPTGRYIELARRLLLTFPEIVIGMTGAPDEEPIVAEVAQKVGSPRCFLLAGKTSLRQLLVLYTLADLLITNDSGPAHFAALTEISVLTLFGPETPALFGSLSERSASIWKGLPCSPCVNAYNNRQSPCRNNLCMQHITVEEVFAAACRLYLSRFAAANSGPADSSQQVSDDLQPLRPATPTITVSNPVSRDS